MDKAPAKQDPDRRRGCVAPKRLGPDAAGRVSSERAHHGSKGRYRALYDNVPLMCFQLDREGNVLSVNEHGARQLGYEIDDLVGRSALEIFHPEDRQAAGEHLMWALETPREVELVGRARDGREAVASALELVPDVLVMGISLPGINGIEATRRIVAERPRITASRRPSP